MRSVIPPAQSGRKTAAQRTDRTAGRWAPRAGRLTRSATAFFRRGALVFAGLAWLAAGPSQARAQVTPVTLQWFETSWRTMEDRTADAFLAGYGRVWVPPPGKGEGGASSIGYNVFDRFDLGSPAAPTRYGTRDQFLAVIREQDKAGIATFVDLVLNHNSTSDNNTPGFLAAGDYPGFVLTHPGDPYGDFHWRLDDCQGDPIRCRLAGLIDIAQEKNHTLIRHPITAGDPNNIPAGSVYDRPDPANRALYPDRELPPNTIGIHPFNTADPMAGDPYLENATGLLLRYTQWMLEVIGADGFRIDAAKHMPDWFLRDFYDRQVWNRGPANLDGSPTTPFSFMEIFDANLGWHAGYVCKSGAGVCNTADGVQGNRDTLDFPLYFSLRDNLSGNGLGSWEAIVTASVDQIFDGNANDGDFGVTFAQSHDQPAPGDSNLAHAYILTRTGSPVVYFRADEFGPVSFPKEGRGDALGGAYGEQIVRLVDIHNEYARWTYAERRDPAHPGFDDVLIFERSNSLLVGLNDRHDAGYDQRTVQTGFAQGTRLRELTGNATDPAVDPNNDILDVVTVGAGGWVSIRVPRNTSVSGHTHNRGYVIYGPANPDGELFVTPVDSTIPPDPPDTPNGRRRLASLDVITADSFEVRLETTDADPLDPDEDDFAMLRIDAGLDINGNGRVDETDPASVGYGFEHFLTQAAPLEYGGVDVGGLRKGLYRQTIDATSLSEGRHYLTVIAFRHRPGGTPPIFETWRKVLYLDRRPAPVEITAPAAGQTITTTAFKFQIRSPDGTIRRAHFFLDQPPSADVVALARSGQGLGAQEDRFVFSRTIGGITSGHHRLDVVAFEESGRAAVVSRTGIRAVINGQSGLGDFNGDGRVTNFDIKGFSSVLNAGLFDPRADLDGDGVVDARDRDLFVAMLTEGGS